MLPPAQLDTLHSLLDRVLPPDQDVVALDAFTGFKSAAADELPDATAVMDPFYADVLVMPGSPGPGPGRWLAGAVAGLVRSA